MNQNDGFRGCEIFPFLALADYRLQGFVDDICPVKLLPI